MRAYALAAMVGAALLLAGCGDDGSGGDQPVDDPQARLDQAADLLDQTTGVSFSVEGDGLPDSGTVILGADGVAAPPASFDGDIRITVGGLSATVEVVSVDGDLWAKLPLTSKFVQVDAETLGFSDPGALISPDEGVSQLLRGGSDPTDAGQVRVDGEVFDQIDSTLPGEMVGGMLAIADSSADVQAEWALDPDTGQLRRAVLTGPFYENGDGQSYTVLLDDYDQPVDISAPGD